jgi:hypothetical protein
MPLDDFRVPKTPETRTPYVLALLAIIGVVNGALRWLIDFQYAVELTLIVAAVALVFAVWRFVRQRPRRIRRERFRTKPLN